MKTKKYIIGLFDDEEPLMKAVKKSRDEGFNIWDVFTPFPVHGLEKALGYSDSRLHTLGFIFGATGTATALGFMSWINAVNYPINFAGKPQLSIPAFIPITFELTVLFASVGMVLVYLFRNQLAPGIKAEVMESRTTDDRFAMVYEVGEDFPAKELKRLRSFLEKNGALEIKEKEVEEEDDED